jgi:hypothetical protein
MLECKVVRAVNIAAGILIMGYRKYEQTQQTKNFFYYLLASRNVIYEKRDNIIKIEQKRRNSLINCL